MLRLRPCEPADHPAVLDLLAARDRADFGSDAVTRAVLLDQWNVGAFDPRQDSVIAVNGAAPIGYGALFAPGSLAFVDPAREGQGAGGALLEWLEQRARTLGREHHRQRVASTNASAHTLLTGAGYALIRGVRRMSVDLEQAHPTPEAPTGITLFPLDPQSDAPALHAADAEAFAASADYRPIEFAPFYEEHLTAADLAPELSIVARRADAIAGFLLTRRRAATGYIDLLAVAPGERRRGLGSAMLLSAFAGFARAGLAQAQLDVASDNRPGLALYARSGMTVLGEVHVFEKPADS